MKKRNKRISFVLIVITLAGITTAFVTVHGATVFQGTVEDCSDNVISGATVVLTDSLFGIMGIDTTDSNGEYSISTTLTGNTPYLITVTKTRFDNGYEYVTTGGTYDFELEGNGEKLAYLFWASDASNSVVINRYETILEDEGYTVDQIVDCDDVESECEDIDDYEIDADTIFVYIMGHGYHSSGHSYTYFEDGNNTAVGSHTFRGYMDNWEANRKGILVESCYSGDWADDFAASPYLAMSSADETHPAYYTYTGSDEGRFSFHFWSRVDNEYTAVNAFNYAEDYCDEAPYLQNPKKQDNSDYTWFDD